MTLEITGHDRDAGGYQGVWRSGGEQGMLSVAFHPDYKSNGWFFVNYTDRNGDTHVDVETDEPQFATVKEGLIGRHLTFVPLGGIKVGPDDLQVAVSRQQVKDAPNIEQHGEELSQADESALYHHYELNYTPPNTQSGRRLARR